MTKEELIENGNDAVRKALEDTLIIVNSLGKCLSKRRNSDEMMFSPKLDCTEDLSTVLFDSEDDAKNVIDNVLMPQEPNDKYFAIKITKYNPDTDGEIMTIQTDDSGVQGETKTVVDGKEFDGDLDNLLSVVSQDIGDKEKDDEKDSDDKKENGDEEHEKG